MVKVVADTNIYISAILFGGKPEEVLNLARGGRIELLVSEAVLAQTARVLKRKFDWTNWEISQVLEDINSMATLVIPKQTLKVIKERDSDNRILECAVEAKAQYILSGDEHYILPLKEYKGVKILSPAEFLRLI